MRISLCIGELTKNFELKKRKFWWKICFCMLNVYFAHRIWHFAYRNGPVFLKFWVIDNLPIELMNWLNYRKEKKISVKNSFLEILIKILYFEIQKLIRIGSIFEKLRF